VISEKPLARDYTEFYKEHVNDVKATQLKWGVFRYVILTSSGRSLFKDLPLSVKVRSVEDKTSLDIIIGSEEADEETNDYLYELFSVSINQSWIDQGNSLTKPKQDIKQLIAKVLKYNGLSFER